jgi:hypothetical protein
LSKRKDRSTAAFLAADARVFASASEAAEPEALALFAKHLAKAADKLDLAARSGLPPRDLAIAAKELAACFTSFASAAQAHSLNAAFAQAATLSSMATGYAVGALTSGISGLE